MRSSFLLAALLLSGCPRGRSPTPSDGGNDSQVVCDTEAEALVRRAVLVTEQIVRTDVFADCLEAELRQRYVACDGDPYANSANTERALRVQSAAMISRETFPVNACVPGALVLPDSLPPLERTAFADLVAFTLLERSARPCKLEENRRDHGCREPYPSPLARVAGRIAHLRVHRAGYTHGVDVEAQNCPTGFVDHDGNGTLDDCARDGEPVVALDDVDGDGVYDPTDTNETPVTRARFLCGSHDRDARTYWLDEMSAPGIADQCVQHVLRTSADACAPDGSTLAEGFLEEACGEGGLLFKPYYFGADICVCSPTDQNALGVFELDPTDAIVEVGALSDPSLASPSARVVGVGDVLVAPGETTPREELLVHDHEALRVLGVSSSGALSSLASLGEAPAFPGLRYLGTVRLDGQPRELVVARRALDEGWHQELMLLDAHDGFRVVASFRSGGSPIDQVGLQSALFAAHTGNMSSAAGEEIVFHNGSRLLVLGAETEPTVRFRVRARLAGSPSGPYASTDTLVGLVDLDGDGRSSVLVRGDRHFNVLGLTGPVGGETIAVDVALEYGETWGTFLLTPTDEVAAILDVDGVPGDEIVVLRRSGTTATLAVLGVTNGDVSARRVLYVGSSAGAFVVDHTVRVDASGDFDADGRGDLVVRAFRDHAIAHIDRAYVELAVISGTPSGSFERTALWRVFETRGSHSLRGDDFATAAGALRSGTRDAFVLAR